MAVGQGIARIGYKWTQGGNVPGGHNVIYNYDKGTKPFITPVRELNSIALRHSDVVIDIGAYTGLYAIRCARFPVKRVVAYEPTPRTYKVLSLTDLPNLETVQAAIVGDDRPTVDLFVSSGIGVTNSVTLSRRKAGTVLVPAVKYADAVKGASIVKIDIEGGEYDLPIVQPGLRAVIIDFHPVGQEWIDKARTIIDSLLYDGFETVVMPDFSNGWTSAGSWIRPIDTYGEYVPLMSGELCCGCGSRIKATAKALCPDCYKTWRPKHRAGYKRGDTWL